MLKILIMYLTAIRNKLRKSMGDDMKKRRTLIAISALGLLDFTFISLYQTGVIKKLPDIPLPLFESNKVNASPSAYQFGVPDGPISATVYGLTIVLAAAGGSKETGRKPIWDILLGGTVAVNAAGAAFYMYDMIFNQKKVCVYCVTGAAINFASAAIIAPIVAKSIRSYL